MDRMLFGNRLRYRLWRMKGEIELRHGMLDPGRNLVLLWRHIRRKATEVKALRRGNPDDPYAMVTAHTRPRVPRRSGSAAVDPYEKKPPQTAIYLESQRHLCARHFSLPSHTLHFIFKVGR
jgi:hypothetical protein